MVRDVDPIHFHELGPPVNNRQVFVHYSYMRRLVPSRLFHYQSSPQALFLSHKKDLRIILFG